MAEHRYIVVNKPFAVLTQFTDRQGRATLKDLVPVADVYPVGRLDYDSEGLVLLTDDAALQHRLSDPRFKVAKVYLVQVEGVPGEAALAGLRAGVALGDVVTAPAEARLLAHAPLVWERSPPIRVRANSPTSWLEVRLTQGMNRQVRRMTAAVGHPTLRLIRTAIGPVSIGSLRPGQFRELTAAEVRRLRAARG